MLKTIFLKRIRTRYLIIGLVVIMLLTIFLFTIGRRFTAQALHFTASHLYYYFPSDHSEYLWQYSIDNRGFRENLESIGAKEIEEGQTPMQYVNELSDIYDHIYYVGNENQLEYETQQVPSAEIVVVPQLIEGQMINKKGRPSTEVFTTEVTKLKSQNINRQRESSQHAVQTIDAVRPIQMEGQLPAEEVTNMVKSELDKVINPEVNSIRRIHFFTEDVIVIDYYQSEFDSGTAEILLGECNLYVSIPIVYNLEDQSYQLEDVDLIDDYSCEGVSSYENPIEIATCSDCGLYNVDKQHRLPSWYTPEVNTIELEGENTVVIDKRSESDFINLYNAARDAGHDVNITSSYRSYETQEEVFEYWVQWNQRVYGYSREQALVAANNVSARPGFSEHQLGTTVDLNAKQCESFEGFCIENEDLWKWLRLNAINYGFVLSYPDGRQLETGYKFEPWHYRWIGRTNALEFVSESNSRALNHWLDTRL